MNRKSGFLERLDELLRCISSPHNPKKQASKPKMEEQRKEKLVEVFPVKQVLNKFSRDISEVCEKPLFGCSQVQLYIHL